MKTKKLSLESLQVKSFTTLKEDTAKGGVRYSYYSDCEPITVCFTNWPCETRYEPECH